MKDLNSISLLKYSLLIIVFTVSNSCDAGFNEVNNSETDITTLDPVLQINKAIINSSLSLQQIRREAAIVKQQQRVFPCNGACGSFNQDIPAPSNWNKYYGTVINNLVSAIGSLDSDSNLYNIARIWKAYAFMIVTDSYGAVPYTEAGKGYIEGISSPQYDRQEFIYTSDYGILEELANATATLDPNKPGDDRLALFGEDIVKWKRVGYSLLLRAAMRLTKVMPEKAENYVNIAVQGGLMQSNDDNIVITHSANYSFGPGNELNGGQSYYQYLIEDFVEQLKNSNDPRLGSIAVRYPGAESGNGQNEANADRTPGNQIGMPTGYNSSTIQPIAKEQGLASFYAYSQADRTTLVDPQAPSFLITYALQQLLLAEAATRGWIQKDPETLYESGIASHMHQYERYKEDRANIPQSEIDAYISAHPLKAGKEDKLEQINTQYWIASYLIGPETWANFRRSGYPDLEPNPLHGDLPPDEGFIRRSPYPQGESTINKNYGENATSPDEIGTRIWWDVKINNN